KREVREESQAAVRYRERWEATQSEICNMREEAKVNLGAKPRTQFPMACCLLSATLLRAEDRCSAASPWPRSNSEGDVGANALTGSGDGLRGASPHTEPRKETSPLTAVIAAAELSPAAGLRKMEALSRSRISPENSARREAFASTPSPPCRLGSPRFATSDPQGSSGAPGDDQSALRAGPASNGNEGMERDLAAVTRELCDMEVKHAAAELSHRRRYSNNDKLLECLAWCLEQAGKEEDLEELQSLRTQLLALMETLPSTTEGRSSLTAKETSVGSSVQKEQRLVKAAAALVSRQANNLSELEQCSQALMSLNLQMHDVRKEARLTLQHRQPQDDEMQIVPKSSESSLSNAVARFPNTNPARARGVLAIPDTAVASSRAVDVPIEVSREAVRTVQTVRIVPLAHSTSGYSTVETAPSRRTTSPSHNDVGSTVSRSAGSYSSSATVASIPIRTPNGASSAAASTSVH
ncbi:hypothetical protein CYMTET_48105, partial [Cymbomonas tetramitiformis]